MTKQKTFKRRVRDRMEKTGESYTAARRMLTADGDRPDAAPATDARPASEEAVTAATGRGWEAWFAILDEWGAASRSHTEIARWLVSEHDVPGWWAQSVTVGYEWARGLRAPGQRAGGGFAVSASKTIAAPVEQAFAAFVSDESLRERWLPGAGLSLRTATPSRSARFDWEDGGTRLVVGFESVGDVKCRVAIEHERLPDAETAAEMKAFWRERVAALKALLEDAG